MTTSASGTASEAPVVYDLLGIGVGPFNLGLAALTEPIAELRTVFLERSTGFDWHPGMMLSEAHLQVPFMADLVTMADPTSPYSFLNYLKNAGRLYPFYIRENFYPLRAEYNKYCQWVAAQLPSVRFSSEVTAVDYAQGRYTVQVTGPDGPQLLQARKLVLGTGSVPFLPAALRALNSELAEHDVALPGALALHNADYLNRKAELQKLSSITVVGSGQSAAEVYFDLLSEQPAHGYQLNWVTRSPRFFPLEYTKLTLEMTSPEYVDYFHALPLSERDRLGAEQKGLYKGIDAELINAIYDLLYQRSLDGPVRTRLITNSSVEAVQAASSEQAGFRVRLRQIEQQSDLELETAGLVFATGYCYREPEFLSGVRERINFDEEGRFEVDRWYSISAEPGEIFVQNAELHSHGFAAPDLGMGAYRNSCIIREVLGWEYYAVERRIAFQEFGAVDQPSAFTQNTPARMAAENARSTRTSLAEVAR
ncbi:lysine N(6)-hydroxylase/L-ornithine N(5)-oxygenase family protein [Psychromicrobium sp. YIM B11713]|uniref:lysine N(6)-hydroxylase/L-ornithine N(5)-oxygenase family protein n=1 Tax=Psychromicrobium sp. YIM B11713 TaxID=3145233 RepID=UPI00374E76EE